MGAALVGLGMMALVFGGLLATGLMFMFSPTEPKEDRDDAG